MVPQSEFEGWERTYVTEREIIIVHHKTHKASQVHGTTLQVVISQSSLKYIGAKGKILGHKEILIIYKMALLTQK